MTGVLLMGVVVWRFQARHAIAAAYEPRTGRGERGRHRKPGRASWRKPS